MEPNVDRGMWSVVALLAAIVIGGVVLLAFPKISGKIANSMDDTVNKAFNGETPKWVFESENNIDGMDEFEKAFAFIKEAKQLHNPNASRNSRYNYFELIKEGFVFDKDTYTHEEWGVSDARRLKMTLGKPTLGNENQRTFFLNNYFGDDLKIGTRHAVIGIVKNNSDDEIQVMSHANREQRYVKPGETKLIIMNKDTVALSHGQVTYRKMENGTLSKINIESYGLSVITGDNVDKLNKLIDKYDIEEGLIATEVK